MDPKRRMMVAAFAIAPFAATAALAAEGEVIDARVNIALEKLYKEHPGTQELARQAKAILVMPDIVKGGFIVGGSYGEGALRLNDGGGAYRASAEYYSVGAASVGFQAGLQETSHALFFLTDGALAQFRNSNGWEAGVDAEVTFPEAGFNIGTNSSILQKPVVGIVFDEDGLLAGASLEGAKYS
ncbi:MAG: YSC84-related protein, partial [Pseudomonadota bacterium]